MERTKILVVDDEWYILDLVIDFLALENIVGVKAENFSKAIEKASSEKFDLIIADVNIENESIENFIFSLRGKDIETHVVLITGDHRIDQEFTFKAGAVGVIYKPFQITQFLSAIKKFLEKK